MTENLDETEALLLSDAAGGSALNIGRPYTWVRAPMVFDGTSEVQRNILARSVLGRA